MPEGPVQLDHNCDLLHGLSVRAYLLFRFGSGGVFAEDVSGYNFHATSGGASVAWGTENDRDGAGLDFQNGTNTSYVTINDTESATAHTKPDLPVCLAARVRFDTLKTTANTTGMVNTSRAAATYAGSSLMLSFITNSKPSIGFGDNLGFGPDNRETGTGGTSLSTGITYGLGGIIRGVGDMSLLIDGVAETLSYSGNATVKTETADASTIGRRIGSTTGRFDGQMFWAMIAAGNPPLDQLGELTLEPYAALSPMRPVLYSFPKAAAAAAASARRQFLPLMGVGR
jgi:hypothetical protein